MAKKRWSKYLPKVRYNNLVEMIFASIKKYGKKTSIRWFEDDGTIQSLSYEELGLKIKSVFYALNALGFKKQDHIAICSETSRIWVYADLGIQALGCVTVAIYPSLKPKEILYILKDSESKAIFVDTQENLAKVLSIEKEIPDLRYIIAIDPFDESLRNSKVISFNELLSDGFKELNIRETFGIENDTLGPDTFNNSIKNIKEDDLASLIYTSGTTGIPKGVMLTHKNFLSDAVAGISVALTLKKGVKPWEMEFCAIMPFSHSFGRCVDEYCSFFIGATMNIVGEYDPEKIRRAFEEFKPTIMCGIPYLYQKIYNIILDELAAYPKLIVNIVNKVIANGKEYYTNKGLGKKNKFGVKLRQKTTAKLVGKVITKKLGGRWQLMVSGSAAISKDLIYFFNTLGINMIEGYGLTETSPVTHLLRTEYNSDFRPNFNKKIDIFSKIGTIGPPIEIVDNPYENIQQKMDPLTGELLIKGPMVMKGYWKKPELTAKAIDENGWLHTGDIVKIDEDGYVKIEGRSKIVIKLSTGKMISPASIETLITPTSKIIAQFILVGDDTKKYLTAIVVPYQQPLKEYADKNNIEYNSWKDLIRNNKILDKIKEEVNNLTKDVVEFSRPKKFLISSAAFTSEKYTTPTYKFKRNAIFEDLKNDIDKLYETNQDFLIVEDRLTDFYDQSLIIS